jgi:hypothetical protein
MDRSAFQSERRNRNKKKKTLRGENMKYLVGCIISLFGGNLQKCCGRKGKYGRMDQKRMEVSGMTSLLQDHSSFLYVCL